jgi:hypothetical protein
MIAKTDAHHRHSAVRQLLDTRWVLGNGVRFEDIEWARGNEDDFDASITAAALLRCCLEELPFSQPLGPTARAEGGILCSGSINLARPEATYRPIGSSTSAVTMPRLQAPLHLPQRTATAGGREFACPLSGCGKVFAGSRGGWDGHVGASRLHPSWHPEVTDPEERRRLFRREYPAFFQS